MKDKKSSKALKWGIALGVILILAGWVVGQYNQLVSLDVEVQNAWAQVETQYQRRADLVPQLVATAKGAAEFEQSTFVAVTEARTKWLETQADPSASVNEQVAASGAFDSALSRLLLTFENYPTLNATENFTVLMGQLEGTENRISVARQDYNNTSTVYNGTVRKFPMMFFASLFGFEQYQLFEAVEGAEVAPTVEFDFAS
jgi:LemA protein